MPDDDTGGGRGDRSAGFAALLRVHRGSCSIRAVNTDAFALTEDAEAEEAGDVPAGRQPEAVHRECDDLQQREREAIPEEREDQRLG